MTLEEQAAIKFPIPKYCCNRVRKLIEHRRTEWIKEQSTSTNK